MKYKKPSVRANLSDNTVSVSPVYCRVCQRNRKRSEFYEAVDTILDTNGVMSVCKSCTDNIFDRYYSAEKDLSKAIYRACKSLNLKFDQMIVDAVQSHIEKANENKRTINTTFGLYKSKLSSIYNQGEELTFSEFLPFTVTDPLSEEELNEQELKMFWGENFSYADYVFLEIELSEWKKSYSCATKSEEYYLKEICLKQLELRKARLEPGAKVDGLLKSMDNLLKNSALTPAQATASSAGKIVDTVGQKIKTIETKRPAEVYADKKLFEDWFDLGKYCQNYISRVISNFFTGNKDYDIDDDLDSILSGEDEFSGDQ